MSRELATFTAEGFTTTAFEDSDGRCHMMADFDVDVDGSGSSHGDPYYQPDTTLHRNGRPLNSDLENFIVLAPPLIKKVRGIVLGCRARVSYRGRSFDAVVGDVGPTRKVGEGSYRLAQLLGMNPSPISGGEDSPIVLYEWWPGIPAVVDDLTYSLQPYRG